MFTNSRIKKNRTKKGGFTLLEIVVTIAVGTVIAFIMALVTTRGLQSVRSAKKVERLHANAVFVADAMTYWIKQGETFSLPNPSTLVITLPDSTTRTIAKTGSRVTLDGAAITTDDIAVSGLTLQRMTRSIRISYTLASPNSDETLAITTTVAERN